MAPIELIISEYLDALTESAIEYVPPSGKKVKIRMFNAGGENSAKTIIRIYWKYGQAGETLIWSLYPGLAMPFVYDLPDGDINGTNKIGMVIDNECVSSHYASGYALIEVND